MRRSSSFALLALAAPAWAQADHGVLKADLRGKVAGGVVEVGKDRVVVALHHDVQERGSVKETYILDRATLATIIELPYGHPETLAVFPESLLATVQGFPQLGILFGLKDGARVHDFGRNLVVYHGSQQLYSAWTKAIVKRHDPATGRVLWERPLGAPFEPEIGAMVCMRDGVWSGSEDRRAWQFVGQDGKPGARHEAAPNELPEKSYFVANALDVGSDELLVLSAGGVPAGKNKRGALFRLVGDGKPKDLVLPGAGPGLILTGRGDSDTVPWAFERKGKRFVVASGRADGGDGEADTYFLIDPKRWKAAGSARRPRLGVSSDRGYILDEDEGPGRGQVVDLATGKVAVALPADAAWWTLTDGQAVAWDRATTTLRCTSLEGGATREVPLGGEATFYSLRHGDLLVALVRRDGALASKVIDAATGEVADAAAHAGEVALLGVADRPVDGRVWFLVTEASTPPRVHVHSAPVP